MAYAGIQMFMEKLNQLIHCNDNRLIKNNPEIISQRPQFQLLYQELGSMVQTLFVDQHQDLGKLTDLKRRFIYAAEEAEYIFDLFLSGVHIRNNNGLRSVLDLFLSCRKNRNPSLNLDDIRGLFNSLKVEFMSMRIDSVKMVSSETRLIVQSASTPIHGSKKLLDEIVVGLERDAKVIKDKLVEDQKKVDFVSIVGMGGIGKTTLATKVFNDRFIMHHFHVRVWVTVSQTYSKRAALVQILESIGLKHGLEEASDSRLHELVHKSLMGRRYLIVIDDIWDIDAWDNLKLYFPHDNTGSRILLTSRFTEVAKHAKSDGLIYHLGSLNQGRSWELLCQKVFRGNKCPEWSINPGRQIVKNCKGLPLAVLVIAGILAKEAWSKNLWMEIAERTGSYIVGEENGCLETLGLSYNHLPLRLRECFLYLGGFPEDYQFKVRNLIWLWVAEGFIEEDENRRLEDIAEGYLMDLINRNLVIVARRSRSSRDIKACKVHDLVRELCLKKAKEEGFILETKRLMSSNVITTYKQVRRFIDTNDLYLSHRSTQKFRSILYFRRYYSRSWSDVIEKRFSSFVLLRVLDLQTCSLSGFPKGIKLLVHLRYLAIWSSSAGFPSSICNLWNLQTLIYISYRRVVLPSNISDLVNLRHLWNKNGLFVLDSTKKPMKLHTISRLLSYGAHSYQKCFPSIKKLSCVALDDKQNDFKSLTHLERLNLRSYHVHGKSHITFPTTLKSLTLAKCRLLWSDISIIQSLPNLELLKLHDKAFEGDCWNTGEHEFPQLKFLRLKQLDIKQWEVNNASFSCLKQLEIIDCKNLEEIPFEIGYIPTLELIKIDKCSESVCESARRIQEEQQDMGNYDLKIML